MGALSPRDDLGRFRLLDRGIKGGMEARDDHGEVERLESLLNACHAMIRELEQAAVRDEALDDALRETCRRIEARLRRLVATA